MKNSTIQQQPDNTGHLPVNCQVLLTCLTGSGGRVPMPDFYRIWEQILPESALPIHGSNIPFQAVPDSSSGDFAIRPSNAAKIREGPG